LNEFPSLPPQNTHHTFSDDQNEEGFANFLDDFAVNVFLPQIEEKVMQLIQHATVGKIYINTFRERIE
jgi:hypothetical protein